MLRTVLMGIALASCLSGCLMVAADRQASFSELEYAPYNVKGTGVVHGEAFLRTRGGGVQLAAGLPVFLNPVTSYSTEYVERRLVGGQALKPADARVAAYVRRQTADSEGRFTFRDLPPGEYYAICSIYWELPNGATDGANVVQRVTVRNGETTEILLTR